jgi:hypothetical protein
MGIWQDLVDQHGYVASSMPGSTVAPYSRSGFDK